MNTKNSALNEYIFIIDRSGSMGGMMQLVNEALKICFKSLSLGCIFNICSFGSGHKFMFESGSVVYNE